MNQGNSQNSTHVEVSEKLSSIKMLLDLLINDRAAAKHGNQSPDSLSSDDSKDQITEVKHAKKEDDLEKSDTV